MRFGYRFCCKQCGGSGSASSLPTSTIDLFLFFIFDLEAEVAGEAAGAVACMVVGMVAGAVGDAVFSVYAVAAAVVFTTYRSLTLVPKIDIAPGDDIMNAARPNVERAPARFSRLMERREARNVGMYIASSFEPDMLTRPWWEASTVDSPPSIMSMPSTAS